MVLQRLLDNGESKVKKSINHMIADLQKGSIVNKDTMTYTDQAEFSLATLTTPESYRDYIQGFISNLGIGETAIIPLQDDKSLKIYKVEEGIYSGHVLGLNAEITHNVDNVTVPEIVNHLLAKEIENPIEEKEEESITPELENKKVVININISKSKENIMGSLDDKINKLCKGKKNPGIADGSGSSQGTEGKGFGLGGGKNKESGCEKKDEDSFKSAFDAQSKDGEEDESIVDEGAMAKQKNDKGRKTLISNMIGSLKDHHDGGHADNAHDISKFLVHLHGKDKENGEMDKMNGQANKSVKKFIKKATDDMVMDLMKCDMEKSEVKLNKEENKMIFDMSLKDMIKNAYMYCKRENTAIEGADLVKKVKDQVDEQIVRKMSWDERFLLAKRSVKYDEKYLNKMYSSVDFSKIDTEIVDMASNEISPMYYSEEKYKIFAERKGVSQEVIDTLEKGNNFFGRELEPQKLGVEFIEKDYEKMSKGKIVRKTDSLIKSAVDSKIKK